jgi:nucleoside-diphosphate-sugar epimerase
MVRRVFEGERFTRAGRVGVVLRFGILYGPGDHATTTLIEGVRRGWSWPR